MSRGFAVLVRLGGGVSLVLFFALAFTPLAAWLSRWLERPAHLEPASAIVVLGGGGLHSDGTLSDSSMRRTLRGIDLYQRGLAPLLVLSGPRFSVGPAEGDVRSAVARNRGVAPADILVETSARTTREEAVRLATVLLPRGARRILLVADAQGMRRAAGVFGRAGFEPLAAPSEDVSSRPRTPGGRLALARRLFIEIAALGYYHLFGYL